MLNAISSYSNIIDRLMVKYHGVMVKYNKHRSVTALVLGIRALGAIFFRAIFDHFLTLTKSSLNLNEGRSFFVCDTTKHRATL